MSSNPFASPAPGEPGGQPQVAPPAPAGARLPSRLPDEGKSAPVGFGRLLSVELRKMLDTRSGKWLLGSTFAVMIVIMAILSCLHEFQKDPHQITFLESAGIALKFLLPIIGIMTITTEWSQRTGLVTFTLEPRRSRVGVAKLLAALALSLGVLLMTLVLSVLFVLFASAIGGNSVTWAGGRNMVMFVVAYLVITAMGMAFGMLLQNTPAAICSFLFLPIIYSIITSFPGMPRQISEWTDPNVALFTLMDDQLPGHAWAKAGVSALIWLVIPLVIGMWRLTHREVKSA